jgi:ribosomal protein L16/L10AE
MKEKKKRVGKGEKTFTLSGKKENYFLLREALKSAARHQQKS